MAAHEKVLVKTPTLAGYCSGPEAAKINELLNYYELIYNDDIEQ